jgi:hypothetical protein
VAGWQASHVSCGNTAVVAAAQQDHCALPGLALHLQGLNTPDTATSAEGFESSTLETVHSNSINKVPADEPAILGGSAAIIHHWDVICLSAFSEAHLTGPEDLAANPPDAELS